MNQPQKISVPIPYSIIAASGVQPSQSVMSPIFHRLNIHLYILLSLLFFVKKTMIEEEKGFNLVCGTSLDKNGINGVKPGIRWSIGEVSDRMLDISKFNSLLVADLDYFIEHHDEIVEMIKERIKHRDNSK